MVGGQPAPQACDEDMQAAGVEEGVVAPDALQDQRRRDNLIRMLAEQFQDVGFTGREFLRMVAVVEPLPGDIELETSDPVRTHVPYALSRRPHARQAP